VREPDDAHLARTSTDEHGDVHGSITLSAGQLRGLVLDAGSTDEPRTFRVHEVDELHRDTQRFWKAWVAGSSYSGRWRESLQRSAITL
jgi:hypothetical protein